MWKIVSFFFLLGAILSSPYWPPYLPCILLQTLKNRRELNGLPLPLICPLFPAPRDSHSFFFSFSPVSLCLSAVVFSTSDFICNQNKRQPVLQRHAAPIKSKSLRVTAKRAMDAQEEEEEWDCRRREWHRTRGRKGGMDKEMKKFADTQT